MKRVMLFFGSFNPVHKGHIALAEYVVAQGLCDEVVLIVSPQSPYKQAIDLAPELERFELVQAACEESAYPEQIKTSAIEFLLPRPSYTVDTLVHLVETCGEKMQFSILLGSDQITSLDGWKEYERLFDYPIYVYPRRDEAADRFTDHFTLLTEAPMQDLSSTQIRERVGRGEEIADHVAPRVAELIRKKGLWSPAARIVTLTAQLAAEPQNTQLYLERAKLYYRRNEWGAALNDFNRILALDPTHEEARQFIGMVQEILEFRYKDIYNP